MDLKGILKECFVEGVSLFIDSAINKMGQETDKILEEELLKHEMMLEEAGNILESIGGTDGTFDEDLKSKEDIWNQAMVYALLLSGRNVEEVGIVEFDGKATEDIDVWQTQWEETVEFVDSTLQEMVDDIAEQSFMSDVSLADACDKFYNEILQLQNFNGGLFAVKKLKKKISCCSQYFASVCTSRILNIHMVKKYLEEESL